MEPASRELIDVRVLATAEHTDLAGAAAAYLKDHIHKPTRSCVAVAGPVRDDAINLTNARWAFSVAETRAALELEQLTIVNDFRALAAGVLLLSSEDRTQIGPGTVKSRRPVSVIGPGTGLGVATICRGDSAPVIVDGEGGHVGFAPSDAAEIGILDVLTRTHGRVSMERLLSGAGIVNMYLALAELRGTDAARLTAPQIVECARLKACDLCAATVQTFVSILGSFAGDIALLMNSEGGVFIGGGIVPHFGDLFDIDLFRRRFEDKGRMSPLVRTIPTFLVTYDHVALRGAGHLLSLAKR